MDDSYGGEEEINANVLNEDEKRQLRSIIKKRLALPPYAGSFLFQEFAERRGTYREKAEVNTIEETTQEKIEVMRVCS